MLLMMLDDDDDDDDGIGVGGECVYICVWASVEKIITWDTHDDAVYCHLLLPLTHSLSVSPLSLLCLSAFAIDRSTV